MKPIHSAIACLALSGAAQAGDLTIRVDDVKSAQGKVLVALYDSADGFLKRSIKTGTAPAAAGSTTVVIKDVPGGEYGIALYHDANGNGKMDSNPLGMPTEDFAFSNNARGNMGAPSFSEAKFTVPQAGAAITLSLR